MNLLTRHPFALAVFFSSAAFVVNVAQGQTGSGPRPFGNDPFSVLQAYQAALNAGDVNATEAVWAEDARFSGAMGCPASRPCIGRNAVRAGFIAPAVAMQMKHRIVGEPRFIGPNQVQVRIEVTWPGIEMLDPAVQRVVGTDLVRIHDGRILSKIYTPDLSDEQTRRLTEALARARETTTSAQQR